MGNKFILMRDKVQEYIDSIRPDLTIEVDCLSKDNKSYEYSVKGKILYRISALTNDDLMRWVDNFDGDLTRLREQEHLHYKKVIQAFRY